MIPKLWNVTLLRYSGGRLVGLQEYSVVAATRAGAIRQMGRDIPEFRKSFQEAVIGCRSIPLFLLSMAFPFIAVKPGGSSDWVNTGSL